MDTHADEHDLAKVLDSVAAELNENKAKTASISDVTADDAPLPAPGSEPVVLPGSPVAPAASTDVTATPPPAATPPAVAAPATPTGSGSLDSIKKDALVELRPLVDKLSVSPEEKFDTYLLLIRSTDDVDLIGPAHEAAKAITDETRRAEALLDIIKEIDYLSQPKK